jgi:hypothetical protein
MNDAGVPTEPVDADELAADTERRERDALRLASGLELAEAEREQRNAPWYAKWAAGRRVQAAEARVAKYAAASAAAANGTANGTEAYPGKNGPEDRGIRL